MKIKKLVNISSIAYNKAEALSWFHAVIMPILLTTIVWLLKNSLEGVIIGSVYVIFLTIANVARLIVSKEKFEHQKSYMYFNSLLYLLILVFIISCFLLITIYGVYHVQL